MVANAPRVVGGFAGVKEGVVFGSRGDVLWVAESATAEYSVELEGVEGSHGVRWGGGVAWTDVRHIMQVHLGDVGWGDVVYFG